MVNQSSPFWETLAVLLSLDPMGESTARSIAERALAPDHPKFATIHRRIKNLRSRNDLKACGSVSGNKLYKNEEWIKPLALHRDVLPFGVLLAKIADLYPDASIQFHKDTMFIEVGIGTLVITRELVEDEGIEFLSILAALAPEPDDTLLLPDSGTPPAPPGLVLAENASLSLPSLQKKLPMSSSFKLIEPPTKLRNKSPTHWLLKKTSPLGRNSHPRPRKMMQVRPVPDSFRKRVGPKVIYGFLLASLVLSCIFIGYFSLSGRKSRVQTPWLPPLLSFQTPAEENLISHGNEKSYAWSDLREPPD